MEDKLRLMSEGFPLPHQLGNSAYSEGGEPLFMRHYYGEEWTDTLYIEISLGFPLNYWRPLLSSLSFFPGLPIDDQQTESRGDYKAIPFKRNGGQAKKTTLTSYQ